MSVASSLPFAIENVGAMHRRGDVVEAPAARAGASETERYKTAADQNEAQRESEAGKAEAVAAARKVSTLGAGCGGV